MDQKKQKQTEEDPNIGTGSDFSLVQEPLKGRYSGIKDDISERDLDNHAVAKVVARNLLGENKELRREITDLKNFKDQYYNKKEETAVLTGQLKSIKESTGVKQLLHTIGGAIIGLLFVPNLEIYMVGLILTAAVCFFIALWNGNLPFSKK